MVADFGLMQLSPSYHPLGLLRQRIPPELKTAAQLRRTPDGRLIQTAGLVVCRQRPGTAKGFVFLLLEDETGLTNVVIRPDLYEAERSVVRGEAYVVVEGRLQWSSGSLNVLAQGIAPLNRIPGLLMPRPNMRHPYPGAPHDPREAASAQSAQSTFVGLLAATPASHDFH
jgi:error-prone DNA polymerase